MDVKQLLIKSSIHGGVAAASSLILLKDNMNVPVKLNPSISNMYIPLWSVFLLTGMVNSVATDGLHYLIKEEVNINQKFLDDSSMILNLLMSAGSFNGIVYLFSPALFRHTGVIKLAVAGLLSEVVSSYVSNMF